MVKNVLAAIDGSAISHRVADFANQLANSLGAGLVLLHVVQPFSRDALAQLGVKAGREVNQRLLTAGQKVLDDLSSSLGAAVETRLQLGVPAETICAEAQACNADLIVLGAYGESGGPRVMLGSVGARVASLSSKSVAIVR